MPNPGQGAERRWTIYVCPECDGQVEPPGHEVYNGHDIAGHYHEALKPDGEPYDRWIEAQEVDVALASGREPKADAPKEQLEGVHDSNKPDNATRVTDRLISERDEARRERERLAKTLERITQVDEKGVPIYSQKAMYQFAEDALGTEAEEPESSKQKSADV